MSVAVKHPVESSLSPAVRSAGVVCLVAGLAGAASGLFLLLVEPQVADSRFSYPLSAGAFIAIQLWFVVQHGGLLAGQWGLWASGVAGRARATTWGHIIAFGGMVLLTVTELVAVAAAEDPYPSSTTDVLDVMYGVATVALGIGLVLVGLAVRRTGAWAGWRRWIVLATGIWVFVPMTPAIALGYTPARLGITGWMLLYAALGWALAVRGRTAQTTS